MDPGTRVERFQLLAALERPVLIDRLGPWDVLRPWNVSAALRVLVGILGGSSDLSAELLRSPNVDEGELAPLHVRKMCLDGVQIRPQLLVGTGGRERSLRVAGDVLGEWLVLGD